MLHSVVPHFRGCMHGFNCMRCLAAEVLQQHLRVPLGFALNIPQEPWLHQLSQLADDQLFAVAVPLHVITRYQAARTVGVADVPHVSIHATAGCGKSTVLNVIKYMCDELGYANSEVSCFSNRLLARLYKANTTIEAMTGVAFKYEPYINAQLRTGAVGFVPTYNYFYHNWLKDSKLHEAINKGLDVMLFDEAWTLHPLVLEYFMKFLTEHGVMTVGTGEVLQVGPKLDPEWLQRNWHTDHAFQMPYWQYLEQAGRVIFLHLKSNHRLPPQQFSMLRRMSLGEENVTDQDLQFLSSLGSESDWIAAGEWFMTLVFNSQDVASYNNEMMGKTQGYECRVRLKASLKDSYSPYLQNLPLEQRGRMCRQAKVEVLSRLHHRIVREHGDGALPYAQQPCDADLLVGLKANMPVMFSQRCRAHVLQSTNGAWQPSGATKQLQAGDLGMVVAILSTDPAEQQQMSNPVQQAAGVDLDVMSAAVLVQVEGPQGPIVRVPVASNDVPLIDRIGLVWVLVNYLQLRIGWCTTVTATQGLEFERVLLDLNKADWLAGGGYTGVGRVKRDLRQGLRIKGGFQGNRAAFNASPAARDWFVNVVLRLCTS